MPRRKRRFESLEDRRLLAVLVGPAVPTSPVVSADQTPASTETGSTPAVPISGTNTSSPSGSDTATTNASPDSPGEYSSPATQSADTSSYGSYSSSYSYGDSYDSTANYDSTPSTNSPSYDAPTNTTSPTPTTWPAAATQPSSAPAQPTIVQAANAQPNVASPNSVVEVAPPAAAAAPSSASPPVAGSSSTSETGSGRLSQPVALAETGQEQQLTAPVALANASVGWQRLVEEMASDETAIDRPATFAIEEQLDPREPIAPSLGLNHSSLEGGIDEVFDRLDRLGSELTGRAGAAYLAQWLVVSAGACAAFEYARARFREGGAWQFAQGGWPMPVEPRLRRHWFSRRSVR